MLFPRANIPFSSVAISNAIIFQDRENIVLDCQEEDNSLLLETVKAVI